MIYRLNEGFGHAFYRVGIEDNGLTPGICEDEML
jgi:GTPase